MHIENTTYRGNQNPPVYAEAGFTFAEVMIAISILAIVISALVGLMTMSTAMAVRAENKARLTDALAQLADQLRAMPYETADSVLLMYLLRATLL